VLIPLTTELHSGLARSYTEGLKNSVYTQGQWNKVNDLQILSSWYLRNIRNLEVFKGPLNNSTLELNDITEKILRSAFIVHTELGPGLLENTYEACLFYELNSTGLYVERQKGMPLVYKEVKLEAGYRVDLLVENKIVVEIKAVEAFNDVHMAQILTYLKLSKCRIGLLLNFNVASLKNGIKRVAH
jgi:GxxExxY protein